MYKARARIDPLIAALVKNETVLRSGSGSGPKLVRPGVYFTGMVSVLAWICRDGTVLNWPRRHDRRPAIEIRCWFRDLPSTTWIEHNTQASPPAPA
jgi:hypothetical protein